MKVKELMTKDVVSCKPSCSLAEVAKFMWDYDCGIVPVVNEEGRVLGVITDRDICMAAYTRGVLLRELTVASAMSKNVQSCSPESRITEVERLMKGAQIRRLPVVDAVGSLVGIITLGDIALHAKASPLRLPVEGLGVTSTLAEISLPRNGHRTG